MAEELPISAVGTRRSLVIGAIAPLVDDGRYPVKRIVGEPLLVTADILGEGDGMFGADLLLRQERRARWRRVPMHHVAKGRWAGRLPLTTLGRHRYAIEAWRDPFATWVRRIGQYVEAGEPVSADLEEGLVYVEQAMARIQTQPRAGRRSMEVIARAIDQLRNSDDELQRIATLTSADLATAVAHYPDRRLATRSDEFQLVVDRALARFSAWYEMFPRSQSSDPSDPRPTTLREAEWRIPDIAAMGFDVVYLTPIHPIGLTNRKGRDNASRADVGDVGSPYAIGSADGGHDTVAPELGGLSQFLHFRECVEAMGMEVALDLTVQVSPDHPYVMEHPDWFRRRPDGSIRHAESPNRTYEDIYPLDFQGEAYSSRVELWSEWKRVFEVWIGHGVKIFRVDIPHLKPVPFWRWLIAEIQGRHPDVIFLSEGFTRPKMQHVLAKVGFTQSYTYFIWRESAAELQAYLLELTHPPMVEYFRGNLFTNTHDILPRICVHGRPAFVIRTVLAATLSSSWGIYSGWELCESARLGDSEEYADSEKYEIRSRDWEAPGNIKAVVTFLNKLRHGHRALQLYDNVHFEDVTGDDVLFYRKAVPAGRVDPLTGQPRLWREAVYVVVNCNPRETAHVVLRPDLAEIGIRPGESFDVHDLVSGQTAKHRMPEIGLTLEPKSNPFSIFTIRRSARNFARG